MHVDTSGIIALEELYKELVSLGVHVSKSRFHTLSSTFEPKYWNFFHYVVQLAVASPQWQVIHKLKLVQFVDKVGQRWFFLTVNEAVEACFASAGA